MKMKPLMTNVIKMLHGTAKQDQCDKNNFDLVL